MPRRRNVVSLRLGSHAAPRPLPGCLVGQLVGIDASGQATVDFPENALGPLPARTIVDAPDGVTAGTPVLLVFEDGDATLPIILGFPRSCSRDAGPATAAATLRTAQDLVVKAKSLMVETQQGVVLRCGQGSVTI